MLALVADLPQKIGNMKFGPQIYRGRIKTDVDPLPFFKARIRAMVEDLSDSDKIKKFAPILTQCGDARNCETIFRHGKVLDHVICSPPYPTEHDYTRHMRLELAFTDNISTLSCLRAIKKTMIRSHTRGLYKEDDSASIGPTSPGVEDLAKIVEVAVADKSSKFEKFYPRVVRAYFGGMRRHFESIYPILKDGGQAAYVVGDQAAYARIPIRTASLLGEVAESVGFHVKEIKFWRRRWATALSDFLDENILVLQKP